MKERTQGAFAGVAVMLGLVASLSAAVSAIEDLRFWPWRGEFETVAVQCYDTAIDVLEFRHLRAEGDLEACEADPERRCWSEARDLRELAEQLTDLKKRRAHYAR